MGRSDQIIEFEPPWHENRPSQAGLVSVFLSVSHLGNKQEQERSHVSDRSNMCQGVTLQHQKTQTLFAT